MMKHYSEKELLKFAENKNNTIENHLKECLECSVKYNFLRTKMGIKSYVEYERAKEGAKSCLTLEKLQLYSSGNISKEEKKRITTHLTCCEKCADSYFDLDCVNVNSLWTAIEETVSETMDWIKGVFLVPTFAVSRNRGDMEHIEAFIGDEVKLEVPVNKEGYLTVLHWNKENLTLVFPNSYEKDNFIKENTVKKLKVRIDPPPGKQKVKVIITEDKILNSKKLDFDNKSSLLKDIGKFIKKLDELESNKWSQEMRTYEVKEFEG